MERFAGHPEDNLTAMLHGIDDLRLEDHPIPEPNDDEVLLRMASVGICGSDIHFLLHGRIGDFVMEAPMVIGHEGSGVVTKCGKNVKHLTPGDRVAIEPGVPCFHCETCKGGRYNLCPDVVFCTAPPVHGILRRYHAHHADLCFKLPDHVSLEEGALLEPLSVAVQACRRAEVTLGSTVLITGAGPIGILNLMVAKAMGASKVIITDLVQNRLNMAKELGADYSLLVKTCEDAGQLAKKVEDILGSQPTISIECTGAESCVRLAILATRAGGCIALVGLGPLEINVPIVNATLKELDIRGVYRYANCYPAALFLVASGQVNVKKLVTHNFKLEESLEAFETSKSMIDGALKVMIHC